MAIVNLNVRLPDELHAALKSLAERDRRSLNAEIVWLLESAIKTDEEGGK